MIATVEKKTTRNAFLAFIFAIVAVYMWMIAGNVAGTIYYERSIGNREKAVQAVADNQLLQAFFYIGMELMLLLATWLMVTKFEKRNFSLAHIGLHPSIGRSKMLSYGVLMGALMAVGSWALFILSGNMELQGYNVEQTTIGEVVAYALLMVLYNAFPGVLEEVLFRGYILNRLMKKRGPVFALIVSSVLFAVIHIGRYSSLALLVYVVMMGILLGSLYLKSGSLYLSIGMHFMWDFLNKMAGDGTAPSPLVMHRLSGSFEDSYAWICSGLIAVILLTLLLRSRIGKRRTSHYVMK